jgi:hypothetical protein
MTVYKITSLIARQLGSSGLLATHHKQYNAYKHALQRARRYRSRRAYHSPDASRWSGATVEGAE